MPSNQVSYTIKTKEKDGTVNNTVISVPLSDEIYNFWMDADEKYQASKSHIMNYHYYIWNQAYKRYLMYTGDRAKGIADWMSNISVGLIRSNIDSYQSYLLDKMPTFNVTGLNEKGLTNKENVENLLSHIAEAQSFKDELIDTMIDGLLTGNYCLKTVYLQAPKRQKITTIVNGIPYMAEYETDVTDIPVSRGLDIYKAFPDPKAGNMRFFTERDVISVQEFATRFGSLIKNKKNKSPLNTDEFINALQYDENVNGADTQDYGAVRTEVFKKRNEELKAVDTLIPLNAISTSVDSSSTGRTDGDSRINKGLIEFKLTTYEDRIVLIANEYPVYVGPNPYKRINYEYGNAYSTRSRFSEGLGFLLDGMEEIQTSFSNAFVDGARKIMAPNYIANRNALLNPRQAEELAPGETLLLDGNRAVGDNFQRLDKGGMSDFGILNIFGQNAQNISGVSDYNQGVAARERVAYAVSALVESTNRRISRYIKKFAQSIGNVGKMWIYLCAKYWVEEKYVTSLGVAGAEAGKFLSNSDIMGMFSISLNAETFLGVAKEMEAKRLIELFNTLAPTGIINSSELAKRLFILYNLDPNEFIINNNVTIPENMKKPTIDTTATTTTTTDTIEGEPQQEQGTEIAEAMSIQ